VIRGVRGRGLKLIFIRRSRWIILPLLCMITNSFLGQGESEAHLVGVRSAKILTMADEERQAYLFFCRLVNSRQKEEMGIEFLKRFPGSEVRNAVFLNTLHALMANCNYPFVLVWGERFFEYGLHDYAKVFVLESLMVASQVLGEVEKAVCYAQQLLQVDPKNLGAFLTVPFLLAEYELTVNDYRIKTQAIDSARNGLTMVRPKNVSEEQWQTYRANLHASLGLIHFQSGQYPQSQAAYLKAIKLDQCDPVLYFRAGLAYSYDQKYEEAVDLLSRSVFLKGITKKPAKMELERVYRIKNKGTSSGRSLIESIHRLVQQAGLDLDQSETP